MEIVLISVAARHGGEEVALTFRLTDGVHTERQTLSVLLHQYAALGLQKGTVTRADFEAVLEAADLCRAIGTGAFLLGYGANSPKQLVYKLRHRGFSAEVAEKATAYLMDRGLIDRESDVLSRIAQGEAKLWGRSRIVSDLYHKGYDDDVMASAEERLNDIDFEENCARLIQKRGGVPEDADERKRLTAFLVRYGYTLSQIKAAMRKLASE